MLELGLDGRCALVVVRGFLRVFRFCFLLQFQNFGWIVAHVACSDSQSRIFLQPVSMLSALRGHLLGRSRVFGNFGALEKRALPCKPLRCTFWSGGVKELLAADLYRLIRGCDESPLLL